MIRRTLAGCLLALLPTALLARSEPWAPVEFEHAGKAFRLVVRCLRSGSVVVLSDGSRESVLGGAGGENLFPVAQVSEDGFHVLWVHYEDERAGFGIYDSRTRSSRVIPLPGLKFAGTPTLIEQAGRPVGVLLLGNASDNDDVFFFDLRDNTLANVTRTPASEKRFSAESSPAGTLVRTVSLAEEAAYRLDAGTRAFRLLGRGPVRRPGRGASEPSGTEEADCGPANTFVAFGDSITYGVMRMFDLEGEDHPELAYPERLKDALSGTYGPAFPVNLGVPGETTYDGALRVGRDLDEVRGLYFLLMMGTNDCIKGWFSADSSMENLAYMIDAARQRRMRVILSTIPPRKDAFGDVPFVLDNIAAFNDGVAVLAEAEGVGFVDTHGAIMAVAPPDGWKSMLEDIGGNHPSPAGHVLIADLFAGVLAAFPPLVPRGVEAARAEDPSGRTFRWTAGCESDLACYRIEYGGTPGLLDSVVVTNTSSIAFPGFPSKPVHFRIQAVDALGYRSAFTRTFTTAEKPVLWRESRKAEREPR